ncbi:MAG: helicase-associated domain-containing protein [Ardenticatenaceae bacterium]|nr:helicase-associated domain-containing protein [Ardenticatenaceae bacterium]
MRQLSQSLQDHDLIILRVIAEWWDLDLFGEDKKKTIELLSEALAQLNLKQELEFLPAEESEAFMTLVNLGGRIPVAKFSRQFGEIREMGPAALEREEPWFSPQSPAEDLWYRGLIFKGFDETTEGLVEFVFLPDEYLTKFDPPPISESEAAESTEKSTPAAETSPQERKLELLPLSEPATFEAASSHVIDDATTLLTLAQSGHLHKGTLNRMIPYMHQKNPIAHSFIVQLLEEMNLIRQIDDGTFRPTKAAVGWLKAGREAAQQQLFSAWQLSDWNALHHVPSLSCEGSGWHNDPISPRKALIDVLPRDEGWVEVDQLVQLIKAENPDFQRPNGNYDTWYIRDTQTGHFLSGFEQWEAVEGQLIHFIVHSPMAWLGMVDRSPTAMRLSPVMQHWLNQQKPADSDSPPAASKIVINAEGLIHVPTKGDRFQRFQVGRFARLRPATDVHTYSYRITPASLSQAKDQGISPQRVLKFLSEASAEPIPAGIRRAIERWDENGIEARLEHMVILRVADAKILEILREHPKTRNFLRESLGELAIAVPQSQWQDLFAAAAQLGLLLNPASDLPA